MHDYVTRLLKTFDFHSVEEFFLSLAPSFKSEYNLKVMLMVFSSLYVVPDKFFGLDSAAFIALGVVFVFELISGVTASHVRKEPLSSMKLSRFSLKVACYLVLIGVSYCMQMSFEHRDSLVASVTFGWLHVFLVVQIVFENIISILENLAVISGKDKAAWIVQIKDKLKSFVQ
jgi:phage-related holin